jgi:hypothetical protein
MTGRRISVLVTLIIIAVFGSLAPASASAAAGATAAPATETMGYLGCQSQLTTNAYAFTRLRAVFCAFAAYDHNKSRGIFVCTAGLAATGVDAITVTAACTSGTIPGSTRGTQSGIPQAGASPRPASSELASGARLLSSAGARPAKAAAGCAVNFQGAVGYQKCGTSEDYVVLDSGSGYGTLQAFVVGTNGALWTAWGTANGVLEHGWESMGGNLSSLNCSWFDSSDNAVVQGYGPDGTNKWCRYRTHATESWGAWFECNGWAIPPDQSYSC